MNELGIPMENLIVICDDLNLPFGTLRMRKKGSDGGHNGLKNIQELLETTEYPRIRIGIGNNFKKGGQVDFVIGPMSQEEREAMPEICNKVIEGIKAFTAYRYGWQYSKSKGLLYMLIPAKQTESAKVRCITVLQ